MRIWALVDETKTASDTCDAMSICGLFTTPEKALAYLEEVRVGPEIAAAIAWKRQTDEMWEGHDPDHQHCFLLTLEAVDEAFD